MSIVANQRPEVLDAFAAALAEPFPAEAVGWKPQAISGNRALAVAYVDARAVMDRLDVVAGAGYWQDAYRVLPCGAVMCRLTIRFPGVGPITKQDVGSPSAQTDDGDKLKAAFSDALKRAAVKFGIGRYLYSLAGQWVDWDAKKKHFVTTPRLPAWALPKQSAQSRLPSCQNRRLARS